MGTVDYAIPIQSLSGRIGNSQMVFYSQNGKAFVRAYKKPANPATGDQAAVRAFLAAAARKWRTLTEEQRSAWSAYAAQHYTKESGGTLSALSGAQIYNKVAFFRQALGEALPDDAPPAAPPLPLSGATYDDVTDAATYAFTVQHGIALPSRLKLMARITPQIPVGRSGRRTDLRAIAGVGAASFADLPASGAAATFTGARFSIPNGGKFLAELTIISPERVPSLSLVTTFTRTVTP